MTHTRIYVASLSDYNSGQMHGVWIDLGGDTDREVIDAAIVEMLRNSTFPNMEVACPMCVEPHPPLCNCCGGHGKTPSAEEWAIHDYDGIPATFGEHPDLDDLIEFVQGVEEHGDAFRAFVEDRGVANFIHEDFQDKAAGEADSEQAWIDQHLEEIGTLDALPAHLRNYFDSGAYLRDLKLSGAVSVVEYDGMTYAFWT